MKRSQGSRNLKELAIFMVKSTVNMPSQLLKLGGGIEKEAGTVGCVLLDPDCDVSSVQLELSLPSNCFPGALCSGGCSAGSSVAGCLFTGAGRCLIVFTRHSCLTLLLLLFYFVLVLFV